MSERTRRLDHLMREEISQILTRELEDPRIGFVTITAVEVSPDLRHATVWVSAIGDPDGRHESMRALERAMPYVRHRLGRLRLRRIPELHVREDDSAERGTRMMELLERLETEESASHPIDPEDLMRRVDAPALPTPGPAVSGEWDVAATSDPGAPAPAQGGRRRVDRAAVRRARHRRGR